MRQDTLIILNKHTLLELFEIFKTLAERERNVFVVLFYYNAVYKKTNILEFKSVFLYFYIKNKCKTYIKYYNIIIAYSSSRLRMTKKIMEEIEYIVVRNEKNKYFSSILSLDCVLYRNWSWNVKIYNIPTSPSRCVRAFGVHPLSARISAGNCFSIVSISRRRWVTLCVGAFGLGQHRHGSRISAGLFTRHYYTRDLRFGNRCPRDRNHERSNFQVSSQKMLCLYNIINISDYDIMITRSISFLHPPKVFFFSRLNFY